MVHLKHLPKRDSKIVPDKCLYSVSTLVISDGVFIMIIPALFHQCILAGVRGGRQETAHRFLFISSIAKLRKAIFGLDGKDCITPGFSNFK